MKSIGSFTLSLLVALVTIVASYATPSDGYCTFYYDKSYRGKTEKCESGDHYPSKWGWYPKSLKLGDGCKAIFYYTDRFGKDKKYTFTRSESDLYRKMASWRFKNNKYWDYIQKVVIVCGGGGHQANNDRGGNTGGGWNDDYKRGRLICFAAKGYKDNWEAWQMGKHPINRFKVKPYALRIPDGHICVFHYNDRNNRLRTHEFKGSVQDLASYFQKWNLRDWRKPYNYIKYIEFKKYNAGNDMADGGNMGGGWNDEYKRGRLICFTGKGYRDKWEAWQMGKHPINRFKVKPYALRIPDGHICVFHYNDRNNRLRTHEFKGSVQDLASYFQKWNLRDWRKPYNYIKYIEFRKYDGNGGHMDGGNDRAQRGGPLSRPGYVVMYKYAKFDGEKFDKAQGSYDHRRLKYIPGSFILPSSLYIVLEYEDQRRRIRSQTFKHNVKDLEYELRELGVYDKKYPLKSVRRIAIMRE